MEIERPCADPQGPGATYFIDRSLGRLELPSRLRVAGLRVVTLAEHYGIPQDETVTDEIWIADSARLGWVALMKDDKIRRRPAERAAIQRHSARCFCLANANITMSDAADRYLNNMPAIWEACALPGPFLYAVHATRIVAMNID